MQSPFKLQQEENLRNKLLANARAMLSNQVAMPLGAVKMNKIRNWGSGIEILAKIDLSVFEEYASTFKSSPVGSERLLWHKEALKEQDKHLDAMTGIYKDRIIDKCFEIIQLLSDNKKEQK